MLFQRKQNNDFIQQFVSSTSPWSNFGGQGNAEETKYWKMLFLFSFEHKKYSCSLVKLRLNPWCHMDYFTDVLAMFLDLDRVKILAVYGRVRELSDSIKNILICVLKMNGGFTGTMRVSS